MVRHKWPPALVSYVCDVDPQTIAWWRRRKDPGVEVIEGCGIAWLREAAGWLDQDAVVYADPPYPLSTRVKKRIYARELADDEHRELLDVLTGLDCHVVVSSYPNDLYADKLAGWLRDERDVMTRGGTLRREVLWTNFDPCQAASPLSVYLGDDFRQREQTKRMRARWQAKFRAMDPLRRRSLLLTLLEFERTEGERDYRKRCKERMPLLADQL